tara:strand:+ start:507 stop:650 length:144 start_codon:yes stop_codon:yes gene_type:complete
MKLIQAQKINNEIILEDHPKLAIIINKNFEKNIRANWFKGSRDRGIS